MAMEQKAAVQSAESKKLLIGVFHAFKSKKTCNEEIRGIIELADEHKPGSMGIELPYDYMEREKYGLMAFFFGDLASQAGAYGIKVIPLERPEEWDLHNAIEVARDINAGKVNAKDIEENIRKFENMQSNKYDKDFSSANTIIRKRYGKALQLLEGTSKRKKSTSIERLIDKSNARREAQMLAVINSTNPDFVVVGASHAFRMTETLKNYLFINALREAERPRAIPVQ